MVVMYVQCCQQVCAWTNVRIVSEWVRGWYNCFPSCLFFFFSPLHANGRCLRTKPRQLSLCEHNLGRKKKPNPFLGLRPEGLQVLSGCIKFTLLKKRENSGGGAAVVMGVKADERI